MVDAKLIHNFRTAIETVLPVKDEREHFFRVLKHYRVSNDLNQLLNDLRNIVQNPGLIKLYEIIRPLIPMKHQLMYDRHALRLPSNRLRVIFLQRQISEALGFSVRGGLEHGVGIFVSVVHANGLAWRQGLRVGDQIVRVNGFAVDQALHEEVLALIRSRPQLIFKVRYVGMLPQRLIVNDPVTWIHATSSEVAFTNLPKTKHTIFNDLIFDERQAADNVSDRDRKDNFDADEIGREVRLFVLMDGVSSLGCSICSGPLSLPGIFIESIRVGSLAEEVGLEVGDQLIDVNGTSFEQISHSEAIVALKASSHLLLTLRRGVGRAMLGIKNKGEFQVSNVERDKELDKAKRIQQLTIEMQRLRLAAEAAKTVAIIEPSLQRGVVLESGSEAQFSLRETDGRDVCRLVLRMIKNTNNLGFSLVGGCGSPLGDHFIVDELAPNGIASASGLQKGDYLLMVSQQRLTQMTLAEVKAVLDRIMRSGESEIIVIVARAPFQISESDITHF